MAVPNKNTVIEVENAPSATALQEESSFKAQNAAFRRRVGLITILALTLLLAGMLLPAGMFKNYTSIDSFAKFLDQLLTNVRDFFAVLANTHTGGFYGMTICRYLAAFIAGALLGCCGAVFQGTFRNPLASPSTLGVVSGALAGSVIYYLALQPQLLDASAVSISQAMELYASLNPLEFAWAVYGRAICAIAGGMIVVGVALLVSRFVGSGATGNVVLVVIGQVFTITIASVVDTVRYYYEAGNDADIANQIAIAEAAPFQDVTSFPELIFVCLPLIAGMIALLLLRGRLNALSFTDDEAKSMGIDVARLRTGVIVLCTVLIGITVAFCGPIVFVGFVSPHVARRVVGSDFRFLLPASLLVGAIFLTVTFFTVSQFDIDMQQGVNLITSIIGCIVFIIVAATGKGGAHAWR